MSATGAKLDRKSVVETQTLATVRQLLKELGGSRGLDELDARGARAHLERDLGLGSLERVELMLRLGDACGVHLPESAVAEANTVGDLIPAILREASETARDGVSTTAAFVPESRDRFLTEIQPDVERQVLSASTLTEVLRLRGVAESGRAHIHLYEEAAEPRTITFGGLYQGSLGVAAELGLRGLEAGQTVAIMLPTCGFLSDILRNPVGRRHSGSNLSSVPRGQNCGICEAPDDHIAERRGTISRHVAAGGRLGPAAEAECSVAAWRVECGAVVPGARRIARR